MMRPLGEMAKRYIFFLFSNGKVQDLLLENTN